MMAAPGLKQQQDPIPVLDENTVFKAIANAKTDDLIDDNGLELMKLSMYEELNQNEKESARSPSDVARCLKKHYDNPQDLLARFIYTLRMLGSRLYGRRAARNLEKAIGSRWHLFDNVPTKSKVDRQRFFLYQHLVTACRLIPPECCKDFVRWCAEIKKLVINVRKYTPCQVLVKLLHENKLPCDDQEDFMEEAMVKAGVSESILEEYEKICIKISNGDQSSRSTSRSRSASFSMYTLPKRNRSRSGSDVAPPTTHIMNYVYYGDRWPSTRVIKSQTLPRPGRRAPYLYYDQIDESTHQSPQEEVPVMGMDSDQPSACANEAPQEPVVFSAVSTESPMEPADEDVMFSAVSTESPVEPADEDNNTQHQSSQEVPGPEQQGVHDERPRQDMHDEEVSEGHRSRKMNSKNNCTRFYRSAISCCASYTIPFIIGFLLLLMSGLAIYLSDRYEWKAPLTLQGRENTSVILAEVHHFITQSVVVTEDTKHIGDFYRKLEIYHLNLPCGDVPTHKTSNTITNLSFSNDTTFYALANSLITFNICGRTNHTFGELERLELVLYKEESQATVVYAIDFFHVGTNSEWEYKESTLYLDKHGYYTITFLPPTHPADFTLNATYSISEIDFEQLNEKVEANYTLYKDQDSHTFPLRFGTDRSCFIAVIGDNPSSLKENVHVKLNFFNQRKIVFIAIGILSTCAIIYLVIVALIIKRHCI